MGKCTGGKNKQKQASCSPWKTFRDRKTGDSCKVQVHYSWLSILGWAEMLMLDPPHVNLTPVQYLQQHVAQVGAKSPNQNQPTTFIQREGSRPWLKGASFGGGGGVFLKYHRFRHILISQQWRRSQGAVKTFPSQMQHHMLVACTHTLWRHFNHFWL